MDKDLLRIVIFSMGAMVVLGIILLHFFTKKNNRRSFGFYDKGNPLDNINQSLVLDTNNDDFDIVSLGSALDDKQAVDLTTNTSEVEPQPEQPSIPNIIQFSLVASADEGFNGLALIKAFEQVGLEFGSIKVFERLDEQRRVDFAVASMVEPGTFPDTDLESFNCPGIVFFLQPRELETPLPIFDDFIQTINLLAAELDGVIWDHDRQPLSEETIQQFRKILS
jgi:cell division protein ZipA